MSSSSPCRKAASCSVLHTFCREHVFFSEKSLRVQSSLSEKVILNNCPPSPYQNHKGAGLSRQEKKEKKKNINSEPNFFPLRITHIHHTQCVMAVTPGDGVSARDWTNTDSSSHVKNCITRNNQCWNFSCPTLTCAGQCLVCGWL